MDNTISILKALADKNRLRVICALMRYDELCACQITELLQVTGATVSRHLSILVSAGLLKSRKEGRWINYGLNPSCRKMGEIRNWLEPEYQSFVESSDDFEILKQIVAVPREDICRRQRGEACCPSIKKE